MPTRLWGALVQWLVALKTSAPAAPCPGCAAAEIVAKAKDAELGRCMDRERLHQTQIQDLQNKVAALADTRAAAVAARITAESGPSGPRPRVPRDRSLQVPAFAAQLAAGGNVDMRMVRKIQDKRALRRAEAAGGLPPVVR